MITIANIVFELGKKKKGMSGTRSTDLPIIDDYARSYCALFELGFLNMSGKSGTKDFSYANYVCFKTI